MSYYFKKKVNKIKFPLKVKKDKFSNFFFLTFFLDLLKGSEIFIIAFHKNKTKTDYARLKFSGLEINELKGYIFQLCKCLNKDYHKFKVIEIHPGCFCIEKNSLLFFVN